ncbi:MAG: trypsin-like serine protease [Bdellovibrionota bacterium]
MIKKILFLVVLVFSISSYASYEKRSGDLNIIKTRIVGGKSVSETDLEAKSTVAIYGRSTHGEKGMYLFCSGTLLHKKLVLTSASCFERKDIENLYIGFGTQITDKFKSPKVKLISIKKVHVHPDFPDQYYPDMAVVEMAEGAPEKFIPAELVRDLSLLKIGSDISLAGYGVNRLDDYKSKAKNLAKIQVKVDQIYADYNMFSYNSQGACRYDDGGPAYLNQDNKLKLMGVIHVSSDYSVCRKFGALGSIPHLAPWIDQVAESILGESLVGKLD